jgi:hypothetical protein
VGNFGRKPVQYPVRRRPHDAGDFVVERDKQPIFGVKLFGVTSQDIYSVHDPAKIPECIHPSLKRPGTSHFEL